MRLNVAASSLLVALKSLETPAVTVAEVGVGLQDNEKNDLDDNNHRHRKQKNDDIIIASFLSQDFFVKDQRGNHQDHEVQDSEETPFIPSFVSQFRSKNKKNAKRGKQQQQGRVERFIKGKLLANNVLSLKKQKECDPSSSSLSSLSSSSSSSFHSDAADVGILGCGLHQYCRESDDSSLGGHCTNTEVVFDKNKKSDKNRKLQETSTTSPATNDTTVIDQARRTCELVETIDELNCQICEFDEEAYTANYDCALDSYCVGVPNPCKDGEDVNFCGVETIQGTVSAPGVYSTKYCYFYSDPIEFNYCVKIQVDNPDGQLSFEDFSCELEISGSTCNSCNLAFDPESETFCQNFDCTNTALAFSGSTCGLRFIEGIASSYFYNSILPCPAGCNLCGDDESGMTEPTATFTGLDGEDKLCLEGQTNALLGQYASFQCDEIAGMVEPCGCQTGERTPDNETPPSPSSALPITNWKSGVMTITAAVITTTAAVGLV